MRKVRAAPFLSLDGFIAGPEGVAFDRARLPHLFELDRIEYENRHKEEE